MGRYGERDRKRVGREGDRKREREGDRERGGREKITS